MTLTRRLLMTGAAATAAAWGLPALAERMPLSRPPTSRARLSQLLVTAPCPQVRYRPVDFRPPFNCRCALRPLELPIGRATYYPNDDILDGLGRPCSAVRISVDFLQADVEVHALAFYDKWTTWFFESPDEIPEFAQQPDPTSHRWTWRPTLANTQGLMTLQFPGSDHQSVTLRSVAGAINLIPADSLVGDFDVAQIT